MACEAVSTKMNQFILTLYCSSQNSLLKTQIFANVVIVMPFLKTRPRFSPSIALAERAEILGATYKGSFYYHGSKFDSCRTPDSKGMTDDFAEDKDKEWNFRTCAGEYATLVKERTEKMFPVSSLKDLCSEAQGNPSGHTMLYSSIFKY